MKVFMFFALFFVLETVSALTVHVEPHYTSPANSSVVFTLKKELVLSCAVTITGESDLDKVKVDWKKGNTSIDDISTIKSRYKSKNEGSNYTVTISDGNNNDVGNWSCHVLVDQQELASATINVVTTIDVKIKTENINVVEEEKLRIECSVLGIPYPDLAWRIVSENYNGTFEDGRVEIKDYEDESGNNVANGLLIIEKVNKGDRGNYTCIATNKYWLEDQKASHSMIRVKDKYAAVWPFLGICIEVVVLCAVIIIYEKKRNKTELEESDTDQSPDQKNTPDHGKEANLRHRQ